VFSPVAAKTGATVSGRGRQRVRVRVRADAIRLPHAWAVRWVSLWKKSAVWLQHLVEIPIPVHG
jgi:hypothetical protein